MRITRERDLATLNLNVDWLELAKSLLRLSRLSSDLELIYNEDVGELLLQHNNGAMFKVDMFDSPEAISGMMRIAHFTAHVLNLQDERADSANLLQRLTELEGKVERLEKATLASDAEYEHYLKLFKSNLPKFEAQNLELKIDEERRVVRYQNLNSPKDSFLTFEINRAGYTRARNILYSAKRRAKGKK